MRNLSIFTAAMLAGCSVDTVTSNPNLVAQEYIGLNEYNNRQQIKNLVGVDPVNTEWCAAFVNAVLEQNNIPSLNDTNHRYPLTARAFLDWGSPIEKNEILQGDIVIFPRGNEGWQGHVGFYVGTTNSGNYLILGGNQANSVKYSIFPKNSVIGIRRWIE